MKTRILSGIAMVPLLVVIYFGGIPLAIVAAAIAYVGVTEFYNGWENMGVKPSKPIAYVLITLLYVMYFVFATRQDVLIFLLIPWVVLAVAASLIYGWKIQERGPYDAIATLTGLIYIVFFSFHVVMLDLLSGEGVQLVWLVVIAAFGSDICAYFSGYFLGKHKMAPNLSPKKTIEGGIGGVLGAALFCWLFGLILSPENQILFLLVGILGGMAGEAGDLTASAFKRKMGIKDYGHLIPGHGGIMDRFDSVIFVAPFVFYFFFIKTTLM